MHQSVRASCCRIVLEAQSLEVSYLQLRACRGHSCFLRSVPICYLFPIQMSWGSSPVGFSKREAGSLEPRWPLELLRGGLRPLVELCVEPAGLCGRCTGAG